MGWISVGNRGSRPEPFAGGELPIDAALQWWTILRLARPCNTISSFSCDQSCHQRGTGTTRGHRMPETVTPRLALWTAEPGRLPFARSASRGSIPSG
jgi:hypothetical protein